MKARFSRVLLLFCLFELQGWIPLYGQWFSEPFLPGRFNMAATAVGTKVMFAGGITNAGSGQYVDYDDVNIYDVATDAWTTAKLIFPRNTFAAASAGGKAFFAGGAGPVVGIVDIVDVYNNATGVWTVEHLSRKRWSLAAASLGSKVYFGGGYDNGRIDIVDIYDTNTNLWSTDKLSEPKVDLAATAGGTKVYFGGGSTNTGKTDVVDVFDTSTGIWSTLTLSQKRSHLVAASIGNKVLFAGGVTGNNTYSDVVDIFDVNTNVRTTLKLSLARGYLSVAVAGTKVLFAGGNKKAFDCDLAGNSDVVDIYDSTTETMSTVPDHLSKKRWLLAAASVDGVAFFAGGGTSVSGDCNEPQGIVDIYDPIPPAIVSVSPTDNSLGVSPDTDLVITFNERIKKGTGDIILKVGAVSQSIPLTDVSISGNTVIINAGTIVGAGVVSVEIAPAVLEDLAGNDFAGIAGNGSWNFTTIAKITAENFPSHLSAGESVSITVEDASKVTTAACYSRGISEKAEEIKQATVTQSGNTFTMTPDLKDKIGVTYRFELIDISGVTVTSNPGVSHIRYTADAPETIIPNLKNGNLESSYQIIAVPLIFTSNAVTSVFKDLGEYNIKKWRLYDYNGNDNREYPAFNTIVPGKGYWLITKDPVTIHAGEGKTVSNTVGTDFPITLKPGWNLIGNPFNFTISWSDVLNYPGNSSADLEELKVFTGGTDLVVGTSISAYRGAFVRNNSNTDYVLKIPVTRDKSLGGRQKSTTEVDLNSSDWQLPLTLTDGVLMNGLGGLGMNKKATLDGKDRYDAISVPILEGIGMFEMTFPHPEISLNFSREIVPPSESHTWEFEIRRGSDKELTLRWDHAAFKDSKNELFLLDPSVPLMRDMKNTKEYLLPHSTQRLKVIFGSQQYIEQKMDEFLPLFDSPYPNPADNEVIIPFRIPEATGDTKISIKVYNMLGSEISSLTEGVFGKGSHQVIWNTDGDSGLFLIQMKSGDQQTKWAKVLVK